MEFTLDFFNRFLWGMYLAFPPLLLLSLIIISLGLVVGKKEGWNQFDSIYWVLITALTVGYGDFKPVKKTSKIMALIISIIGIMLFGIIVAITVNTFGMSLKEYRL